MNGKHVLVLVFFHSLSFNILCIFLFHSILNTFYWRLHVNNFLKLIVMEKDCPNLLKRKLQVFNKVLMLTNKKDDFFQSFQIFNKNLAN